MMANSGEPPILPIYYDNLIFDGACEIDTDYLLPENASLAVYVFGEQKVAQTIVGAFSPDNGPRTIIHYGGGTNSSNRQVVAYYDSTNYLKAFNVAWTYTPVTLFLTPKRCGVGNTSYYITKGNTRPENPLLIGCDSGSYFFTGTMRTLYIYGSDAQNASSYSNLTQFTPIATFSPCTYNGEAGMWYVEGNRFCGKTRGNGTLTVSNI